MKTVIANKNGRGNARSNWYFSYYNSEREALREYENRKRIAEDLDDGWDVELLLISEDEVDELNFFSSIDDSYTIENEEI